MTLKTDWSNSDSSFRFRSISSKEGILYMWEEICRTKLKNISNLLFLYSILSRKLRCHTGIMVIIGRCGRPDPGSIPGYDILPKSHFIWFYQIGNWKIPFYPFSYHIITSKSVGHIHTFSTHYLCVLILVPSKIIQNNLSVTT